MDQHFRTVMRGIEGLTATVTREMDSMQSCLGRVESRLSRMEDRLEGVESRLALAAANATSDHTAATPHPGAHANDPEAASSDDSPEGAGGGGPHVCAVCAWCRKGQAKLVCGHCKDARYCSQECQRSHWRTHKGPCKAKRTALRFVNSVLYLVVARGFAKNVLPALRLCRDTWKDERVWRVIINTTHSYKLSSKQEKPRPCTETRLIRECRRLCSDSCLPPHPATHGAAETTIKRLLSYGADANARGGALCEAWEGKVKKYSYVENTMALVLAAHAGRSSVCRILLEAGALPSIPFTDKDFPRLQTALGEAAKNGDLQLVKLLLEHGANPDDANVCRHTPLFFAVISTHAPHKVAICKLLVGAGADVNFLSVPLPSPPLPSMPNAQEIEQPSQSYTPFSAACNAGHDELVELMLGAGAQVEGGATERVSPLGHACVRASAEVVRLLLQAGASVNKRLGTLPGAGLGLTPLGSVCASVCMVDANRTAAGITRVGRLLLAAGADPNLTMGPARNTALHFACESSITGLVSALISANADVNAASQDGATPLIQASINNLPQVVSLLLEAGADDVEDALERAIDQGATRAIEVLTRHQQR